MLLLNAGHFWRNIFSSFGTPLSAGDESYVNEVFTPSAFVSNFSCGDYYGFMRHPVSPE